jgi:VIT1/CCC1 family predicted Fe2+/Mn2+ transporter
MIDALMYLMARLSERGRDIEVLRRVQRTSDPDEGRRILASALPDSVASVLETEGLERVRERLQRLPEARPRPRLAASDLLGAAGVFLWVFAITFPVVVPFLFIDEAVRALRISNLVAVVLLFVAGCSYGRWSSLRPLPTGIVMVVVGTVVVAVTIALGG